MTKSKSTFIARLKLLTAMPVAFMLVVAFTASPIVETIAQVEQQKQEKKTVQKTSTSTAEKQVFTVVEVMPQFPGGEEGRIKYLKENVNYPEAARKQGIEGTVFVTFVVEKDGSVTNARVLRGIGGGCDEEALRVVSAMPNWKPGMQRGKPVRVQFNVPIKFNLNKEKEVKDGNDKSAPPPPPKKEKK